MLQPQSQPPLSLKPVVVIPTSKCVSNAPHHQFLVDISVLVPGNVRSRRSLLRPKGFRMCKNWFVTKLKVYYCESDSFNLFRTRARTRKPSEMTPRKLILRNRQEANRSFTSPSHTKRRRPRSASEIKKRGKKGLVRLSS